MRDFPSSLDSRSRTEWADLAARSLAAAIRGNASTMNAALARAAAREPQSPAAPAYRLWLADGLARDGRYVEAVDAYDRFVEAAGSAGRLTPHLDIAAGVLFSKAKVAALSGDRTTAVTTYEEIGDTPTDRAQALLQAGWLVEAGDPKRAAKFYSSAASEAPSSRTDDPAELARRAVLRLEDAAAIYFADAGVLAERVAEALGRRAVAECDRLLSRTHFAVGPVGGHTAFEGRELLEEFFRDLRDSSVTWRRKLRGSGDKLYFATRGWRGRWFSGDVVLILNRTPQGWQWTGLGVTAANSRWAERWRPQTLETNQPLPFDLLAPWPAGMSFTAGGLTQFAAQQSAVISAGWFGPFLSLMFARSPCGYGPRGLYYNTAPTHDGNEAFAIDFTRYRQYLPFDPESGGTPVLAARSGIVVTADHETESGCANKPNIVEIEHEDPMNPPDPRFLSRYLHLEGPFKIPVSKGMPVVTGTRLGFMDDTGNSILDHLHFAIHDRKIGASVRPTRMSGVRLEDRDSGTCVLSTNVEYMPMEQAKTFAVENWLITPAASAANEALPSNIQEQKWLLVLSGVAIVDVAGTSGATWLRRTVSIFPSLTGPLNYAVGKYGIPRPPADYRTDFEVEQYASFAGLSSLFNHNESVNSGFAVDAWRPNPFRPGRDAFSGASLTNLFAGIQVDLAVRDSDAWIHRVSYHVTLLGRIVFDEIVVT